MATAKPKRRTRGTGNLRERPKGSGTWQLRVYVGQRIGKPPYECKTIRGVKNITEARSELAVFEKEWTEKRNRKGEHTIAELLEAYIGHLIDIKRAQQTIDAARRATDDHIVPVIGKFTVEEIGGEHIDHLFGEWTGKGMSPESVKRHGAVLSAALTLADKWGWRAGNPYKKAELPVARKKRIRTVKDVGLNAFLGAAAQKSHAWGMIFVLSVLTGARRGEVCALRWNNIVEEDYDGDKVLVLVINRALYSHAGQWLEKETKTDDERRIPVTETMAAFLREWRIECEARAAKYRVVLVPDAFIVPSSKAPDGARPTNPETMSAVQGVLAAQVGIKLEGRNPFRHRASTATLDGKSGVAPRDAADMLGHSDVKTTLERYTHGTTDRSLHAAEVVAKPLLGLSLAELSKPPLSA